MKKIAIIIIGVVIITFVGCDDPDCIRRGGMSIGLRFYDLQEGEPAAIRINTLQVLGSDSILFDGVPDVTDVILPVNPATDSITVLFDTELGTDTLVIGYQKNVQLISEECGTDVIYEGITIIRRSFDSVRVVNRSTEINFLEPNVVNENIQVFN